MENLQQQIKDLRIVFGLFIFVLIAILGGLLNLTVVAFNDGAMPVYLQEGQSSPEQNLRHFVINNLDEIAYGFLSDFIYIDVNDWGLQFYPKVTSCGCDS